MRLLAPLALVVLATACVSDYRSRYRVPTDCERRLFFEDADGDGWGDPEGLSESRCQADPEQNLTARNNLDCDDGDELVTGRIASLCPAELVVDGADYIGAKALEGEVAAVLPTPDFSHVGDTSVETTPLLWAEGAASACGDSGWGGKLATFDNFGEFTTAAALIEDQMADEGTGYYAAWVGAVPAGTEGWRWVDGEAGEGLAVGEVGWCADAVADRPDPGNTTDPGLHLAMVKAPGEDWCFGFPSDANPPPPLDEGGDPLPYPEGTFLYDQRRAHFLCERATPLPSEYTIDVLVDPASE